MHKLFKVIAASALCGIVAETSAYEVHPGEVADVSADRAAVATLLHQPVGHEIPYELYPPREMEEEEEVQKQAEAEAAPEAAAVEAEEEASEQPQAQREVAAAQVAEQVQPEAEVAPADAEAEAAGEQ
ncbi:hypothetical protein EMWEY_00002710 [Eimeria maxima]|uniref:Uncharacterized protein n=1 Tax=Eimeria maxima TaxID=5804 RepID=U6M847_EIMMA|nr:hypothetical protein EMWEY_00002710 [Eimeria maxima]CDJ58624.1 hypothetical protein EMWEY_00002710 [Eimeria maxima]